MKTRTFALLLGIVFLVLGILGFVPGLLSPPTGNHSLRLVAGTGRLFGVFPVNVLHDLLHLAFGVWGVVVWRTYAASRVYARSVAVIYAIVAVLGLVPALGTVFGLVPIYGDDVWLHGLIAVIAALFGFTAIGAGANGGAGGRVGGRW